MSKIVVLNSGGFDSVVLMNFLHSTQKEDDIYSIHFRYGANNEDQQLRCVRRVCNKVGAIQCKIIDLPKMGWTKSKFFEKDGYEYKSQYLEYRNLIFIAYALSYAESIGANKIYLATLKSHGYTDTSDLFFEGINSFSKPLTNIEIIRPFSEMKKMDLLPIAISNNITKTDYFSCDVPKDKNPCGCCDDCNELKDIEEIMKIDAPFKAFYQSGFNYLDPEFKRLLKQEKITEIRALINNRCQLKCKHCFYGFDEMKDSPLTREEYYKVLKEAVMECHIENIHFSGKEPLFNDDIIWYANRIKEDNLPCTFNIVTNGINVPKYAKQLKDCGIERIFLSVDDVCESNGVRNIKGVSQKALSSCEENDIPVEIFIDLHHNNFNKLNEIISYLLGHYSCIHQFFVRTIRSIGNAENQSLIDGDALTIAFNQLKESSEKYTSINFILNIGIEYSNIMNDDLFEVLNLMDSLYTYNYYSNFVFSLESYCGRYENTITLTPDGYILGCASEVASKDYDKISVGNVRDYSVKELIQKGKDILENCNDCYSCGNLECNINKIGKSLD